MSEALKAVVATPSKLTPPQIRELEKKCHNRLNWSDGGHWIGAGAEPNCFQRNYLRNEISHTFHFPTDQSATNWNLEWEKAIRYTGHLATTGLTVAVTLTTGGLAGIVVGSLAAILKDEAQAKIPYPRAARGWSYEVIFKHEFNWSPHPWGQRQLTQEVVAILRDYQDQVVERTSQVKKYHLEDLPEGLGRLLASAPSKKTHSDYL